MYIPPHFQWLEARQGPPPGDSSSQGPSSQDSPDSGEDSGSGMSTRTTVGIIVRFVLTINTMDEVDCV